MPITKSAKKSLKVSRAKQAQNYVATVILEKALRKADATSVNNAVSLIDKAAKIGLMHKNKAARLKSQLSKKFGTPAVTKSKVENPKSKVAKETVTKVKKTTVKAKSAEKKPKK